MPIERDFTEFDKKIRVVLEEALISKSVDLPTLAKAVSESESDVEKCFFSPSRCQPAILFKISHYLGTERTIMRLFSQPLS